MLEHRASSAYVRVASLCACARRTSRIRICARTCVSLVPNSQPLHDPAKRRSSIPGTLDSCSSIASTQSEEKKLYSWDSCSTTVLTQSNEELNSWDSISSIVSTLSKDEHGISIRTGDDEDDKEGVECKDKEECAAIPSATRLHNSRRAFLYFLRK